MTASELRVVCTISNATLGVGASNITFAAGEFTTGLAVSANALGLTISTSLEAASSGASLEIVQGRVHSVSMAMAASDLWATKRTTSDTIFSFSTQGDLIIGLKLTVTLPADYFIAQSSPVGVLSSSAGFASLSCSLSSFLSLNVICTVGNATLPAGAHNISFAAGQLTTGSTLARDDVGLSVKTDVDRRSVFAPSLEISAGRVQSASMSMSVEDGFRFKSTTSSVSFNFTTQSDLFSGGSISIILPSFYFSLKAAPAGVVASVAGSGEVNVSCAMITLTLSIVCTTSGATLPAGGPHRITFAKGELTTGSEIASSSTGLKIKTSAELVSAGATSLAILQGQVHGVSMMMSDRDRVSLSICWTFSHQRTDCIAHP
jgi:hypothetical protein